jgi:hypothetical protein
MMMPEAIRSSAPKIDFSSPYSRAKRAEKGETIAKASKGNVISMPASSEFKPKLSRITCKSGLTAVKGALRFVAINRMPIISKAGRTRGAACWVGIACCFKIGFRVDITDSVYVFCIVVDLEIMTNYS